MNVIVYRRHFVLLAGAAVILLMLHQPMPTFGIPDHFVFASYGALHALVMVGSLGRPSLLLSRVGFVCVAALLSISAVYVGVYGAELLPDVIDFFAIFGLASAFGALTYGLLVKLFWLPSLSGRQLFTITFSCVAATYVAFFVGARTQFLFVVLALMWWTAFSVTLFFCIRHTNMTANYALERTRYG